MSSNEKIIIKQESLLPGGFKFFGGLLMVVGAALCLIQFNLLMISFEFLGLLLILVGLLLILGGLLLITAHYRLEIDPLNKTYHIYPWLLGYQSGTPESFKSIEKIYINPVNLKQSHHSLTGKVNTAHSSTHKAFMKLDNGEKIHLDTDANLKKLEARVASYEQRLKGLFSK